MERLQVTERHTFFMKYYLAPMEGLTTYNFRTNWNRCYGGMDKYFTPFISAKPNKGRLFNYREKQLKKFETKMDQLMEVNQDDGE